MASGALRYNGRGGRARRIGQQAEARDEGDVRNDTIADDLGRDATRPGLDGEDRRAGPGEAQRSLAEITDGGILGGEARHDRDAPVAMEGGEEDMAVSGVDRDRDETRLILENQGRGERGEGRDANGRHGPGQGDRAGSGYADAEAGERAGADGDRDTVDRGIASLHPGQYPLDKRDQRLGMATLHAERLLRVRPGPALGQDAGGDGRQRRVDRKDSHKTTVTALRTAINSSATTLPEKLRRPRHRRDRAAISRRRDRSRVHRPRRRRTRPSGADDDAVAG